MQTVVLLYLFNLTIVVNSRDNRFLCKLSNLAGTHLLPLPRKSFQTILSPRRVLTLRSTRSHWSILVMRHTISVHLSLLLLLPLALQVHCERTADMCQNDTEEGSAEMPEEYDGGADAPGGKELEELVHLVQIVLGLNIVFP